MNYKVKTTGSLYKFQQKSKVNEVTFNGPFHLTKDCMGQRLDYLSQNHVRDNSQLKAISGTQVCER